MKDNRDTGSYFDFAEEDYKYLKATYEQGFRNSSMASMAQNACEKFLKHIIENGIMATNEKEETEKTKILRSHSLNALIKYLKKNEVFIDNEVEDEIIKADGFYFASRYPGDDSFFADEKDVDKCINALNACREYTIDITQEIKQKKEEMNSEIKINVSSTSTAAQTQEVINQIMEESKVKGKEQTDPFSSH